MWQQPIYDRTSKDITDKTNKGYLNYTDMNRIEGNIEFIAELMGVNVITKSWNVLTLPTSADFTRIISNIRKLEDSINFTAYKDSPNHPINTFNKINLIESLIASIKGDYDLILGNWMYCGDSCFTGSDLI